MVLRRDADLVADRLPLPLGVRRLGFRRLGVRPFGDADEEEEEGEGEEGETFFLLVLLLLLPLLASPLPAAVAADAEETFHTDATAAEGADGRCMRRDIGLFGLIGVSCCCVTDAAA